MNSLQYTIKILLITNYIKFKRVKASHTRYRVLGPELIPV